MESKRQQKQLKKDNLLLPWANKVERTAKTKENLIFAVSLRQKGNCREDEIGRGKVRWSYGIYMTVRENR